MRPRIPALTLACLLSCVAHASAAPQRAAAVHGEAVRQETPEQVQQLVAPIALYPDALVAQILGASTYPTEIVEADRWMQQHSTLKGKKLAQAVDQQSWDPSVKALAQFPSVLADMDKNLSWASALGDAYVNQQQAVLEAEFDDRFSNPYAAAERGFVDEVLAAHDTRRALVAALDRLCTKREHEGPHRHANTPL